MDAYVIDTSVLLSGREVPRDRPWWTTPEAAAEIGGGGRTARRYQAWLDTGLQVRAATPTAIDRVADAAHAAGNLARLSAADTSLLALALEHGGLLVTDDHTMLDVAARLGVQALSLATPGIRTTLDWKPRCSGCGRWFDTAPPRNECPVCGSMVRPKPRPKAQS